MKLTHKEREVIDFNKNYEPPRINLPYIIDNTEYKDFGGKYEIENHPQVTVTDIIVDIICLVAMAVITIGMVVMSVIN